MKEIWKDIEGYSDYQVSNLGRVKSLDRYIRQGARRIAIANMFQMSKAAIDDISTGRRWGHLNV